MKGLRRKAPPDRLINKMRLLEVQPWKITDVGRAREVLKWKWSGGGGSGGGSGQANMLPYLNQVVKMKCFNA